MGKVMPNSSIFYVSAYVLADVVRSLFAEAMYSFAPNRKPFISSTLVVFMIELSKLFAAFTIVLSTTQNFGMQNLRHFVIPAGLFFTNSCLYYWILAGASAGGLSLLMQIRLPCTAIAHHFMVKKQKSWRAWTSLAFVFVGVLIAQVHANFELTDSRTLLTALIICVNSSLASVVNERTLKTLDMPFWDQQLRMYFFGVTSSAVGVLMSLAQGKEVINLEKYRRSIAKNSTADLLSSAGCIISGATAGILTGFVTFRLDNVVKVIANSMITVVVNLASFVLFGIFPFIPVTFVVGSLILVTASYAYVSFVQSALQNATTLRKELPISNKIVVAIRDKNSALSGGLSAESGD